MNAREAANRYRMAQWSEILRERSESGESITKFCERRGISRNRYFYWQRRLRQAACEYLGETESGQQTNLSVPGFAKVSLEGASSQAALPAASETVCGLRIEIGDVHISADENYPPDKLSVLLRGLMQC